MNSPACLRVPPSIGSSESRRRGSRAKNAQRATREGRRYLQSGTTWRVVTERLILAKWVQAKRTEMPSKPVNVKQVLIYLTHAQHAALLKIKDKTGTPVSESIRRAIDRYLKQTEARR